MLSARRRFIAALPALLTGATFAADAPPHPDLAETIKPFVGRWEGNWRLGMNSGKIVLVVTGEAQAPGTIAVTNLAKFGDAPAAIERIEADSAHFNFRSAGEDNSTMKLTLQVAGGGTVLHGTLLFDDFANRCMLRKVQ